MKVVWLPQAQGHFWNILATIRSERGDVVAAKWQRRIFDSAQQLEIMPHIGAEVPELGQTNIREVGFPPYRVIYRVSRDTCHILAVLHSRQSLSADEF